MMVRSSGRMMGAQPASTGSRPARVQGTEPKVQLLHCWRSTAWRDSASSDDRNGKCATWSVRSVSMDSMSTLAGPRSSGEGGGADGTGSGAQAARVSHGSMPPVYPMLGALCGSIH